MDRDKANKLFEAYGRPMFKSGNNIISFARQTNDDILEIESLTDDELIEHWKSLVWMNEIYGQVSLNDLQRISLLELEIDVRHQIKDDDLTIWYDSELDKLNNKIEKNE